MSKFRSALLAGASFVAFHSFTAFADDATPPPGSATEVPPIVVTATRSPVPLNQIASSMTVITNEEIEQQNAPDVTTLLREVPGITVDSNGGPGQTARVFMRGTNSNHVLVMIDGMVVNDPSDPSDAFDFSNITTDNIDHIEVLRGPQSTLYGSDAIGGVINIITKQGEGAPKYNGFAEYGRYNTSREGVGTSGEIGRTSYDFQIGNGRSDGISALDKRFGGFEKDGYYNYNFSANVASKLTDNFTLKVNARDNRNDAQIDSIGSYTRPYDDSAPRNDSRQFNGRVEGDLSLFDGFWTQELGVSTLDTNRDQITIYYDNLGDELFGRQQELGRRDTVDWLNHFKLLPDNTLTVGTEAYTDYFKTTSTSTVNVDNKAVFADDQFNIGKDFFMNAGVREDDNQSFGDQFTWKVAPGYRIEQTGTTLKATYGTAFKAPSLSNLYDPTYGNPDLQPEKSKGWDAGFEQALLGDKVTFGSTLFRNDIRDLIGNNPLPPYASINTGKARTEGVENVATIRPSIDWTLNASYTYTLAEDRSDGTELLRRPKHQATAGATYQYSMAGDVGMDVRYSSSRRDIDINYPYGPVYVKSFTTVDLTTNYKLTPNLAVYGRLDNLLDKHYEEVYGYGEPGMSLFAGLKANY